MNKYIVEKISSGAVYIFGIESIQEYSGVYIGSGDSSQDIKPLALITFNTFKYKIHGPSSEFNNREPEVDTDGRFCDYKSTILPLTEDGKVDSPAYLEFESDTDAKLFAEVLRSEYLSKKVEDE